MIYQRNFTQFILRFPYSLVWMLQPLTRRTNRSRKQTVDLEMLTLDQRNSPTPSYEGIGPSNILTIPI